jgi:hypothetical protein
MRPRRGPRTQSECRARRCYPWQHLYRRPMAVGDGLRARPGHTIGARLNPSCRLADGWAARERERVGWAPRCSRALHSSAADSTGTQLDRTARPQASSSSVSSSAHLDRPRAARRAPRRSAPAAACLSDSYGGKRPHSASSSNASSSAHLDRPRAARRRAPAPRLARRAARAAALESRVGRQAKVFRLGGLAAARLRGCARCAAATGCAQA